MIQIQSINGVSLCGNVVRVSYDAYCNLLHYDQPRYGEGLRASIKRFWDHYYSNSNSEDAANSAYVWVYNTREAAREAYRMLFGIV